LTREVEVRSIGGVPDEGGPQPAEPDDVRDDDVRDDDVRDDVRVTVRVSGRVQGVGFRWWTRARALELGLVGSATNLDDGRVEVVAQGSRAACGRLVELLSGPGTPGRVQHVASWEGEPRPGVQGFLER
jgi:acylphosphatase